MAARKTTRKKAPAKKRVTKTVAKRKAPVKKATPKKTRAKRKTIKKVDNYTTVSENVLYINANGKKWYYDGKNLDDSKIVAKGYRGNSQALQRDAQKVANATGKPVYKTTRTRRLKKKR